MTELRDTARRCADAARGMRLSLEADVWHAIADRGEEWQPPVKRRGQWMKQQQCFRNAALTAMGWTALDPDGLQYAEGFALNEFGLWVHHAWVVSQDGEVTDRTWREPGLRYLGVTFDADSFTRPLGNCQLTDEPCGFAFCSPELTETPGALEWITQARR